MMELRYYQNEAVDKAISAIDNGLNPLLILPTGAGKSLIIAELCRRLNKQILVITPRIKLLEQNSALIDGTGILSGNRGDDTGEYHQVICGTAQTLIKRTFVTPEVIIIDEAHMIPEDDSEYYKLLAKFPDSYFVGLTATPFKGRQTIYDGLDSRWKKSYEIGVIELIEKGFLVPPRAFKTNITIEREHNNNEELTQKILPVAAEKLRKLNRHRTLVFCRDIQHIEQCFHILQDLGENVLAIHSEMSASEHKAIYAEFNKRTGHCWLINCNMLTTGVDLPSVDAIVILRKISEGGTYIQIIGRGLRNAPHKDYCAVLDYGKNSRFGAIDSPEFLKPVKASGSNQYKTAMKSCPECDLLMPPNQRVCDICDYEFPIKPTIEIISSSKALLSIDIRQAVIEDIEVTKKDEKTYMLRYIFNDNESALRFVSKTAKDKLIKQRGIALYRVSKGIAKIISIHS
ncbi:MAG: DEAD/DEAH box helicase [Pseudoalteromonas prydzensis]|uniref:DEAD/DEAH box helicase n=1 Tax=Pseudoalteromonas prydzensis TaxID=182141 RepID=UPI003F9B2F56